MRQQVSAGIASSNLRPVLDEVSQRIDDTYALMIHVAINLSSVLHDSTVLSWPIPQLQWQGVKPNFI